MHPRLFTLLSGYEEIRAIVEEEEQQLGRRCMTGYLPLQMAMMELMDPTWLGMDDPLLLEHTPIPNRSSSTR